MILKARLSLKRRKMMINLPEIFSSMSYLYPALIGGIGVALIAGPMGAFMVWRRLAYFSDTIAHSGLLGVTIALILNWYVTFGITLIALAIALLLFFLQQHFKVASDTLLGLLSHTALALGLLTLSLFEAVRVDVLGFLYGDILTMNWQDVAVIYGGLIIVYFGLAKSWSALLQITIDKELAQVEGMPVIRIELAYNLLLALVIALSVKIVGVLLMTALLLIPATSARSWSESPEQMAALAAIIGAISIFLGLVLSHVYDVPTGPMIVVVAACSLIFPILKKIS
jgi:zinc transport system permease protein